MAVQCKLYPISFIEIKTYRSNKTKAKLNLFNSNPNQTVNISATKEGKPVALNNSLFNSKEIET